MTDQPDEAARTANIIATIVGLNTPFYPLCLLAVGASSAFPTAWWTASATPFFLAIPVLARRHPLAARVLLPLVGIANTVFCTAVLGAGSGTAIFLLPCLMIAMLLYRAEERRWLFGVLGLGLLAVLAMPFLPDTMLLEGITDNVARLNFVSAACLTAFAAWRMSTLLKAS